MISIRSSEKFERAMEEAMDPDLRRLLTLRRDQLIDGTDADLGDLAQLIVVGRERLAAVEAEAGFPLVGDDAPWEWAELHGRWVEAVMIVADDYAVAVFAKDCVCTDPALLLPLLALARA